MTTAGSAGLPPSTAEPPASDERSTNALPLDETLEARHTSNDPLIFTQAEPPFAITHVNAAWERLCGFQAHEAVGKSCKILQGPETSPEILRYLHEGLRSRVKLTVRLLNYSKNGMRFLNDLTVTPLRDRAGEITHFEGRIRPWRPPPLPKHAAPGSVAEAAARPPAGSAAPERRGGSPSDDGVSEFRKKLPSSLLEAVNFTEHAMVITERSQPFRIVHVNEAWCELCGFTMEETLGLTCRILQGPGTCQATLQALTAAAVECAPITVKLLNYRKVPPPNASTRCPFARARHTHPSVSRWYEL